MPRLPPRSTREIEQLLLHHGFRLTRSDGGHNQWRRDADGRRVTVPRGRRSGEIAQGTLASILRQAGISREEALRYWRVG